MKIGALAKATGVSIRTLHHYDEIGLLTPSDRTESGHRVYTKTDIVRLHRILALRKLGLSLQEIEKMIGESKASLRDVFDRNIESLSEEIEQKQATLDLLKGANEYLEIKDNVDIEDLTATIREFSVHQEYYSKEQLETLRDRQDQLGKDKLKEVINAWPDLVKKVRQLMDQGVAPSDPRALEAAKKWLEMKDLFTGGDQEIEKRTQKMYRENPEMAERYGVEGAMFEYVQKAADHMRSSDQTWD